MRSAPVLFDLGNVLVKLRFDRGNARFRALAGPTELFDLLGRREAFGAPEHVALEEGRLGPDAFLDRLAERLGAPGVGRDALASAWCDIFDPWPEMEALAAEVLDAGHPAYLLSNTNPIHFAHQRARMPVLGRMTGLCLSYEIGWIKPDPAFFLTAIARFGLEPARASFVDDVPANVEAAETAGIPSFLHTGDVAAVRAFLRRRGVEIGP